jgi:outer membrane protein
VRRKLTIAPVLALACGLSAWAQTPQKIATIDMQAALLNTKDGQKAVADLKAKFTPKEQEFQKRQSDLQAKQDQYRRTENTISEEAKATLARDIDTMTKNLQRDTDDVRQDIDQEQQKVLNELGQKMMQVLQKYANDKQLTLVLDVSGQPSNILFASSTVDITRDIISLYDNAPPVTNVARPTSNAAPPPAPKPAAPRPATPAKP